MNEALARLAASIRLDDPEMESVRLAFGLSCAARVRHLIEDAQALACLDVLQDVVDGNVDAAPLKSASDRIAAIANHHRGSGSNDGTGHAAVSATYAAANALAGRALAAASYAAYAIVYAYAGYAASDPAAYAQEFDWQVARLRQLAAFAGRGP